MNEEERFLKKHTKRKVFKKKSKSQKEKKIISTNWCGKTQTQTKG